MNALKQLKNKYGFARLFYALYFMAYFLLCLIFALISIISAPFTTQQLALKDFTLLNIEQLPNGYLLATNEDPQLVLNTPIKQLHNLRYSFISTNNGGEASVFYAKSEAEGYSTRRAVWARRSGNEHSYAFSSSSSTHFRIDPTNIKGTEFIISDIKINYALPLYLYFIPTYTQIFYFILLPALAAAVASYINLLLNMRKQKD